MQTTLETVNEWLHKNQKIAMPVLAILSAILLEFLGIYFKNLFIPYIIPFAVFLSMHYTGYYGVKKRLLYGLALFFVIWILAVSISFPYSYTNPGPQTLSTSNGGTITTTITPFNGVHNEFNLSSVITSVPDNQSYMPSIAVISDTISGASLYKYYNLSDINVPASGVVYLNFTLSSLPVGIYYIQTNLIGAKSNYNVTSNVVKGPLDITGELFYFYLLVDYLPLYVLFFEIILAGGIMFARSLSHSNAYRKRSLDQ